jgi:hypothetical protein
MPLVPEVLDIVVQTGYESMAKGVLANGHFVVLLLSYPVPVAPFTINITLA